MTTINKSNLLLFLSCLIIACSPVDSTKVFDQEQTAKLLHQHHAIQPMRSSITLNLPKQTWRRIDISSGTIGSPIMLIPANDSATHWQQSIRTQLLPFMIMKDASLLAFFNQTLAELQRNCQHVQSTILEQTSRTLIYRFTLNNCYDEENQTQIGKAFVGEDAIYAVYYSATPAIPEQQINQFAQVITSAKLTHDPRRGITYYYHE